MSAIANDMDKSNTELLEDFCSESFKLLLELESQLNLIEREQKDYNRLENFGQVIDRIMGTSQTLGMDNISTFCELSKVVSYKASQVNDPQICNVVLAILFDAIDLIKKMVQQVKTGSTKPLENLNLQAFATRLKWLSGKFKHIDRSSCNKELKRKEGEPEGNLSQSSIDQLLENLGL